MLNTLKDGIDNVVLLFDDEERYFQAGKPMTGKCTASYIRTSLY